MTNKQKDIIYFKIQIEHLKETCINQSFDNSKNIIDELFKYDWNVGIITELKKIYVYLLSSDYNNALKRINLMLNRISSIISYILYPKNKTYELITP